MAAKACLNRIRLRIADVIAVMECEMTLARLSNADDGNLAKLLKDRQYTAKLNLAVVDANILGGDVSFDIPVSIGSSAVGLAIV